jgi:serine/threonine protein kinase
VEEARENPTKRCLRDPGEVGLLRMPDGGTSWKTYKPSDPASFLHTWISLFDAVEALHAANIAHMDIKHENILTQDVSGYQTRLIDFGFSFSPATFQETKEYTSLFSRAPYFPWPFEVHYLDPDFDPRTISESTLDAFYRDAVAKDSGTYPPDLYYTADGSSRLDVNTCRLLYSRLHSMSRPALISFVSKQIDVYSLGRALSYMYVRMTGHIPRHGTVALASKGSEYYTLFPHDPEFALVEQQSLPFFELIRSMMQLDPFQRPTISEAKQQFLRLPFLDTLYPDRALLPPPSPGSPTPHSPRTNSPGSPVPYPPHGGTLKHKRRRGTRRYRRKRRGQR